MDCKMIGTLKSGKYESRKRIYDIDALCPTLNTCNGGGHEVKILESDKRIRRLTPREYWRLMGFADEDFDKAQAVNSNTQLYKQAGNSIVVQVLEAVLKQLLVIK